MDDGESGMGSGELDSLARIKALLPDYLNALEGFMARGEAVEGLREERFCFREGA